MYDTSLSFTKYREKTTSSLISLVTSLARSENTNNKEEILKMTIKLTIMNTQNLSDLRNLSIVRTNSTIVEEKMPFKYERGAPTLKSDEDSQSISRFFDEVNILGTNAELSDQEKINWARHYASVIDETL